MIKKVCMYLLIIACIFVLAGVVSGDFYTNTLEYSKTVNMGTNHKAWGYIDDVEYNATLNDGDSINIDLTTASSRPIDIVEFRFYNTCNDGTYPKLGKFYAKVNNLPVLPTIGFDPSLSPVWFASPECPKYGTTPTFIFDTNDTKGNGLYRYNFVYNGYPIKIKTLEYYITTVN